MPLAKLSARSADATAQIGDLRRGTSVLDRLYGYPEDVLAGRIITSHKVRLACERFRRELDRSKHDPDYPWVFDEQKAARPSEFMERFLRPTKGNYPGMILMPWQCFVEGNMYGWVDKKTGLRRFRESLIVEGRGNGKTTLIAGNVTYMACKDGERGADIYLLANAKEQAKICYEEAYKQIKASPTLRGRFRLTREGIFYEAANATIKARASDSSNLDGLNPHLAVFDEIHELTTDGFKLIDVIRQGMLKRDQPLTIYITTMGNVLDGVLTSLYAIFSDALEEGILPPEVADRMFAFICELDPGDDIEDSSLWIKANPALGVLLDLKEMENEWQRVRLIPQERANFITKHLCVTVDSSEAAYLPAEILNRNRDKIDMAQLLGRPCYGGYDLSSREDFTAAALLFPLDDGRWFVLHHSWTTKRKVELDNEKIDYHHFAMLGLLTICDGDYVPQDEVYKWFRQMGGADGDYEILSIGYDPANAVWCNRALEAEGFATEIVRQGPLTLNDPMKSFREAMMDGRIVTNDDPMLRWYMHNVRLRNNYLDKEKENWMPTKHNRYRKIDGFMALIDAWCVGQHNIPTYQITDDDVGDIEVYALAELQKRR